MDTGDESGYDRMIWKDLVLVRFYALPESSNSLWPADFIGSNHYGFGGRDRHRHMEGGVSTDWPAALYPAASFDIWGGIWGAREGCS